MATFGEKEQAALRRLFKQYEKGTIKQGEFEKQLADWQDKASSYADQGRYGLAGNLRSIMENKGSPYSMMGGGPTTDMTGGTTSTGTSSGDGTSFYDFLPDRTTQNVLAGKGGENIIGAMMLEQALQGQQQGIGTLQDRLGEFQNDPLVQQLTGSAQSMLEEPLISEEMLNQLLGANDATLSQSYQNQNTALVAALGGRNIDPRSGVLQGLAARNRFNTLQASGQQRIGTTLQATQMNRAALEDAMRLGLATSGFTQGVLNQGAANIANLQAGQPLAGIGPELMSMNLAQNMNFDQGGIDWGQFGLSLGGGLLGAAGGAAANYGFERLFSKD